MPASSVIAAYNNMAKMRDPVDGEALLIGLEAFVPLQAQVAAGDVVSVGHITAGTGRALVATRSIRASPFPQEKDAVYFAGYDANKVLAHHTARIMRSTIAAAIGVTWPH